MSEILGTIDVNNYGLQSMVATGGGGEVNLQSKDVTINQNGTTTITADQGYDGLSDVDVTVSGILDTSDATATEEDIVNPKTAYVNGVKLSGQLRKSSSLTFTDLERIQIAGNRLNLSGLTTTRTLLDANRNVNFRPLLSDVAPVIGAEASKIKKDEVICGVTGTYEGTKAVLPNGVKFGTANSTATDFSWLADVDTSNLTNGSQMFQLCSMVTMPTFDTSNMTNMGDMFSNCSQLVNLGVLNTSKVTNMGYMFSGCSSLSNESLNNILAMCTNSAVTSNKTLKRISLSSAQAETCQTLSNWDAFVAAGWSTGY